MADARRARGEVMLGDGTLVTGTCVSRWSDYVTLCLDDDHGRPTTIDSGGRQLRVPERRVRWLDA